MTFSGKITKQLKKGIRVNRTEARYIYGNPIIDMLCDAFHYKLQLEEFVVNSTSMTAGSEHSKFDYCCWRIVKC